MGSAKELLKIVVEQGHRILLDMRNPQVKAVNIMNMILKLKIPTVC